MKNPNSRILDFIIVLVLLMACAVTIPSKDDRVTYDDVAPWQDKGCNSCHENYKD